MAARRSTKVKIMVTSPELEDTVLVAAEGDNSRLSSKESFGKISISSSLEEGKTAKKVSAAAKTTKKSAESAIVEEPAIIRYPKNRTKVSGETASSSEVSDFDEPMMHWTRDDNTNEMVAVQKQLGLKPARIRPTYIVSSDDENNSESEISIDGDEIIPAEMLQTWETGSTMSQSDDDDA